MPCHHRPHVAHAANCHRLLFAIFLLLVRLLRPRVRLLRLRVRHRQLLVAVHRFHLAVRLVRCRTRTPLLGLLPVLHLVLNQVVEGGNRPDQTADVDAHELIVRLDAHGPRQLVTSGGCCRAGTNPFIRRLAAGRGAWPGSAQPGQKVEDVLQVAEHGVVHRQFAGGYAAKVDADVAQA